MRNRFKINGLNIKRFTAVMVLAVLVFALSSCNGLFGGRGDRTPQKQKVTVSFSALNDISASINENAREGMNTTTLPSNLSENFSEVVKIELIVYVNENTLYDFTKVSVTGAGVIDTDGKNKITWETSQTEIDPVTVTTAYQKMRDSTIELFCDTYKFTLNLYIETSYNPAKLVQTGTLTKEVTLETTSIAIPTTYCPEKYGDFSYSIYWPEDCGIDKIEAGLFTSESKGDTAYSIPDGESYDFEALEINETDDGTDRKYVIYTVENIPAGNYVLKYKLYSAVQSGDSTNYYSIIPNNGSFPVSIQINGYKTEKVITLDKDKLNQLSKGDGGVEIVSGPDLSIVPNPRDYFDEDVCYLNKGSFVITSDFLHNKYTDDTSFINSFDIKLYYGNNLVPLSETQYPDSLPRSDYFSLDCNSLFTFTPDDPYIKAIIFSLEDEHKLLAGGYYSLYVTAKIEGTDAISSMYYTFYVENKEYYEFWLDSYSSAESFESALINKLGNISSDFKLKICGNPSNSGTGSYVGYFKAITDALDECNSDDFPYLVDLDMSETGDRLVELSDNDWIGSTNDNCGNGIRSIKFSPYVQTVGYLYNMFDLEEVYLYDAGNLRLGELYFDEQANENVFIEGKPFFKAPRLSKFHIEPKDAEGNDTVPKYDVVGDKIVLRTVEDSENGNYREIFFAVHDLTDGINGPDMTSLDLTDESVWGTGCADASSTACIKKIDEEVFLESSLNKIISLGCVDDMGDSVFSGTSFTEVHIEHIPAKLPNTAENYYNNAFTTASVKTLYVDMEITAENYETFRNYISSSNSENAFIGMYVENAVFNQDVVFKDIASETGRNTPYYDSLFYNSHNALHNLTFKKNATIGKNQFFLYNALRNVSFEYDDELGNESVIAENAFLSSGLQNVNLGSTATIGAQAFKNCQNLITVTIGECLTAIEGDNNPFYGCSSLESFTVASDNNYYKTNGMGNILVRDTSESYRFAEIISVASIVDYFDLTEEDYSVLEDSESTIESIGKYAFSNCVSKLNFLDLTGIVYIGDYAFADAASWSVTNFAIPSSTVAIGLHAFDNSNGDSLFGENSSTVNFRVENTDDWYGCYNGVEENMSTALKEWAFAENEDKPTIGSPGVTGSFVLDDEYEFTPLGDNLAESMKGNVYSCYYRDTKGND